MRPCGLISLRIQQRHRFAAVLSLFFIFVFIDLAAGQRVAAVVPEEDPISRQFVQALESEIRAAGLATTDSGSAKAAFSSLQPETPLNLTADQAKLIGSAIGADSYLLVRCVTQRRTSLQRVGYFESSAAIFVVSSRTGRLVHWSSRSFDSDSEEGAERGLIADAPAAALEVANAIKTTFRSELAAASAHTFPEVPAEGSPEAQNYRPPVPYNRIRPKYTTKAYLFGVQATVEIEASIAADGSVAAVEIVRWAGYGLDESVVDAVRSMNWRAAERNGKSLSTRVLLRYNFKKIDAEPQ